MHKILKAMTMAMGVAAMLAAAPAAAGSKAAGSKLCGKLAAGAAMIGAAASSASKVAGAAGIAALPHSSGPAILSSVGVGGTGYMAGTFGTAAATALGIASSPVVIFSGAVLAVGAGSTYAYCKLRG